MNKLPMCRICLAENVRMYVVVNSNLQELYEKLTNIPFITEDSRPILACFFCCAKLKQCYRLLRQCLEAEELFAQMMNENYEAKPLINQDHLEFYSGFIKSPIEHITCIDDGCQTENIDIKEELPAVCEGLDDIIEPKEEHQSDELELENFDNSCLDVADIPVHHSESDLNDDVPVMEFKIEVEEEQVSKNHSESDSEDDVPLMEFKIEVKVEQGSDKKRRASETNRTTVAKKPKLDTRRTKLEDAITAEQKKKAKSDSKVIRTTSKSTSNPDTYLKEPYKCDQRSFNREQKMIPHTRTQIGEKPTCDVCQRSFSSIGNLTKHGRVHAGEKPYKCDVCHRSFIAKSDLTRHIRIHTGEKPHKCDLCQRSFSRKGHLSQHILIHTGEKPYKCNVCQRSFGLKGHLKKHTRIHTGEKPYKCDVCHRSFRRMGHLSTHIRIHTGEKPYKCDICQRSFTQKGDLTKHNRIHTSEKPYKCDVCQCSFNRKGNLSTHIRIHCCRKTLLV